MASGKQHEIDLTCSTSPYPLIQLEPPQQKRVLRSNSNSLGDPPANDALSDKSPIDASSSPISPFICNNDSLPHISPRQESSFPTSSSVNLVVVKKPPRRTIFISRLSSATTEDDIINYISSKTSVPSSVKCIKYNFKEPRDIASFKLLTPDSHLELLLSREFWPDGTLVHEYVSRTRNTSSTKTPVPAPVTSHPKND